MNTAEIVCMNGKYLGRYCINFLSHIWNCSPRPCQCTQFTEITPNPSLVLGHLMDTEPGQWRRYVKQHDWLLVVSTNCGVSDRWPALAQFFIINSLSFRISTTRKHCKLFILYCIFLVQYKEWDDLSIYIFVCEADL